MNKIPKSVKAILPEVFTEKCRKLLFKYKGWEIYEPLYDKVMICDFPRYILVFGDGTAALAFDDDCIEIQKLASKPNNKLVSAGYDTTGMPEDWVKRLADDIE